MGRLNKYGFVSGGHIFGYLDETALKYLNLQYPWTKSENWFTASADIKFCKQWCDEEYDTFLATTENYYSMREGKAEINVKLFIRRPRTLIAEANFVFVKANKNFCEIKKEEQ